MHIRKYGRSKMTECGAPASRLDFRSSAWLAPTAPKCPECLEAIRVRMLRHLEEVAR